MKLFAAPGTVAVAPAMALIEAAIPHEIQRIDFAAAEQTSPDYARINPKGRVPALALEDGTILTETGALLEYIAAVATDAKLVPDNSVEAAHMRSVMYYLASTMHVAHAHKMRGTRWADSPESHADMTAKVPQTMTACARYIEENAFCGPFTCGHAITLADFYLFAVCSWLEGDGVTVSDFPKITAFLAAMSRRDSAAKLRQDGWL
ncbi:glutathione S-transferase family protein [Sulfitobacter albidus]|uniref:Glutathione S-transferase family protein n=1 Tax=Sulfitobacter albidus TaxID=2829501 RepID=A0A975PML0_9RHOB|nr:glutathione S-transferase family protein [Sulfitobacter albidus]QUJ76536.1 glutathione S-transferase family protein [Sulfitobacter albidus]